MKFMNFLTVLFFITHFAVVGTVHPVIGTALSGTIRQVYNIYKGIKSIKEMKELTVNQIIFHIKENIPLLRLLPTKSKPPFVSVNNQITSTSIMNVQKSIPAKPENMYNQLDPIKTTIFRPPKIGSPKLEKIPASNPAKVLVETRVASSVSQDSMVAGSAVLRISQNGMSAASKNAVLIPPKPSMGLNLGIFKISGTKGIRQPQTIEQIIRNNEPQIPISNLKKPGGKIAKGNKSENKGKKNEKNKDKDQEIDTEVDMSSEKESVTKFGKKNKPGGPKLRIPNLDYYFNKTLSWANEKWNQVKNTMTKTVQIVKDEVKNASKIVDRKLQYIIFIISSCSTLILIASGIYQFKKMLTCVKKIVNGIAQCFRCCSKTTAVSRDPNEFELENC